MKRSKFEYIILGIFSLVLLGFVLPWLFSAKSTLLVILGGIMSLGYCAALYHFVAEDLHKLMQKDKDA